MRHDGKRQLQLFVSRETLETIRRVAKARKTTMSAFVTECVDEKMAREIGAALVLVAQPERKRP
jgi:hypothetical protein